MTVTYRVPGAILTEREHTVPLDHAAPGDTLTVFTREVAAPDGADRPYLVFLQGGPGFEAPRPTSPPSGWIKRALADYRVLLLDQRGTGRSTPANRKTLARFASPRAQADYLAHFRADSIVADAELIRPQVTGGEPWGVLGQSFGGFCTVSYLSFAPHGIREAFVTGGLPGLTSTADDVYRLTYRQVAVKNREHYERYPMDVERARRVARSLAARPAALPDGGRLTVPRFQSLGQLLGSSTGSHVLHYLLETPFAGDELTDDFLQKVQAQLSFAPGPLYAALHEACYAQGGATRWSAQRIRAEYPEFDAAAAVQGDVPLLFTGEMIYPWAFELDPVLTPLTECAEMLAAREDWPALYDAGQLGQCDVPVAAAVYHDDMYVPRELSLDTAAATRGLRRWVTDEYEHDGLRVSNGGVLDRLIRLARGEA